MEKEITAALKQRSALFVLFFVTGVALSSWVTRTPDIRNLLGASIGEMGTLMLGLSCGAMVGLLGANTLIRYTSTRWVASGGVILLPTGLLLIAASCLTTSWSLMVIGLFIFGFGMGSSEIPINLEGSRLETTLNKTFLPKLHGFFSSGVTIGALIGIILTHLEFPVYWHLGCVALLIAVPILRTFAVLPDHGLDKTDETATSKASGKLVALLKDKRLWGIAIICMAMALAEGSANDWLPLLMVTGHGFDPSTSAFIYTLFALGMAIGRFFGNPFIQRYGRPVILCVSALSCAIGLGLAIFTESTPCAILSVLFWGIGASLGFPVAISAASASGNNPSKRVSFVAVGGYCAFLVGPPLLGFIGQHYGLRASMVVVLAMVVIAAILSPGTRARLPSY